MAKLKKWCFDDIFEWGKFYPKILCKLEGKVIHTNKSCTFFIQKSYPKKSYLLCISTSFRVLRAPCCAHPKAGRKLTNRNIPDRW